MARHRPADGDGDATAGAVLRIDRWLWHARFYKSRALATSAVSAGQVRLNGERVKASRPVRAGDRLALNAAGRLVEVDILALPVRRGPAPEARTAYAETEESLARAVQYAAQQRLGAYAAPRPDGRPDKKARRQLRALGRGQGESGYGLGDWAPYEGDGFGDADADGPPDDTWVDQDAGGIGDDAADGGAHGSPGRDRQRDGWQADRRPAGPRGAK